VKAIVSASVRVCPQFYDLDPMNIVWHGNYPRFFELARTALMAKIGYGYDAMVASGYAWPVIDMHIRYYRPLRLGHWVDLRASLTEWENRLKVEYLGTDEQSGKKTTTGHTLQVALDVKSEAMLWQTPPILREKLAPFMTGT
jgi:acyl-CoA thioester hydrolase